MRPSSRMFENERARTIEDGHTVLQVTSIAAAALILTTSAGLAEEIKPEMIVRFTQGGVACLERDHLQEMTEHAIKGEATKAVAMLIANGGDCLMLPPSKRFKVLATEYNVPDLDIGLLEIVGEDIVSLHGAWAFSVGAEQVQPAPSRPTNSRDMRSR